MDTTDRPWLSEALLVAVLAAFAIACMAVLTGFGRAMPAHLAAASVQPTPVRAARPIVATKGVTAAPPKPTAVPTPEASATPTDAEIRRAYAPVAGSTLARDSDTYKGRKIVVTGTVFYMRPDGESTWIQVITPDRIYIDASYRNDPSSLKVNQKVLLYGTGAGTTTIVANDGKQYQQPFINPADYVDVATTT